MRRSSRQRQSDAASDEAVAGGAGRRTGRPRAQSHRTTRNKDEGRGSPQGAPISPLLANLYMRRFVLGWKTLGHQQRFQARIVNYADDFVICCRGTAEEAMAAMRNMMARLKLTVNERKTTLCRVPGANRSTSWGTRLAVLLHADGAGLSGPATVPRRGFAVV